jgi:hypothetical protein
MGFRCSPEHFAVVQNLPYSVLFARHERMRRSVRSHMRFLRWVLLPFTGYER